MSAASTLKLQAAGFTAEQVTAIADLIDRQSATKADVEAAAHRLDAKIEETFHKLDLRIAGESRQYGEPRLDAHDAAL